MLVTIGGAYVSLAAINIHSDEFDHLVRYKFVQDEPGVVDLQIVPGKSYCPQDGEQIKRLLEDKVNHTIRFNIKQKGNLEVMKNGKYKIIEQKIPLTFGRKDGRGGVTYSITLIHAGYLKKEVSAA